MSNVYMNIHAIQSVPPSNINRDDTGSPKTAVIGGVRRAFVSSQSWKRAMRDEFHNQVGMRTLNVPLLIAEDIMRIDPSVDIAAAKKLAEKAMKSLGKKGVKIAKDDKLAALFFISHGQIHHIAQIMLGVDDEADSGKDEKTRIHDAMSNDNTLDMALFGRMVADDPSIDVDAAAQVAPAFGVSKVNPEFDFYTAIDDNSREDHAGSAMMGTIEFNASVYYRYANVGLTQLRKNLRDDVDVAGALADFVNAFIVSMPTGKKNSFANATRPDMVLIEFQNTTASYAGAFEKPVAPKDGASPTEEAEERLADYITESHASYDDLQPLKSLVLYRDSVSGKVKALGDGCNLTEMLDKVAAFVNEENA